MNENDSKKLNESILGRKSFPQSLPQQWEEDADTAGEACTRAWLGNTALSLPQCKVRKRF